MFLESALSWSIRPPLPATAFRSAVILPSWAIDPVLSSASATRILTLPQVVVDVVLRAMLSYVLALLSMRDRTRMNWVWIELFAVITTVAAVLLVAAV